MVGPVLESHVLHSAGSPGSPPSGAALVSPTLVVHLLQESLLLCWAVDVPAVCGELDGSPGALPGREEEGSCSETEKAFVLKAAGHWASSGLTKQPVSRMCPQPGGMALS